MNHTKYGMLKYIQENMAEINIPPFFMVHSQEFFEKPDEIARRILHFAGNKKLAVRSSSGLEDTSEYSNAGKYKSILNVRPDSEAIKKAVQEVYNSYASEENEEILIQIMVENVVISGVAFTADSESFTDYYVINYCEGSDTDAVTSGKSSELKTFIHYKKSPVPVLDGVMRNLVQQCSKIEEFLHNSALDIEFAIDKNGLMYVLQVRPIAKGKKNAVIIDIEPVLTRIYKKVKKLSMEHPFLLGHTTCFGVMPDWNPAEILGIRPKKLSISLYKELVTDNVWAHQRHDYGYRDMTMHPLMISFCGIPYIDTRITFNSFIPKKLNERIAEKLVNYYLDKLTRYPKYHDKIEFEIVFSCYYLGLHKKLRRLLQFGFNENEITRIEFSLLELTNNIINPKEGLYKKDIEKIHILEKNYDRIVNSNISLVDKIYWLIEECKAYGTLPFAGVARAGFVAIQFLNSFVEIGIISKDEYDAYMNSLETVNKKMNNDLNMYYQGKMSREKFIELYGHIRPGTYDIMSSCYEEAFYEYFGGNVHNDIETQDKEFFFSEKQIERIQTELDENGLLISAKELINFIKESIEGREYLKFVFTKSVSKILKLVEELGKRVKIAKEDMAHLDISIIKQLYVDLYTGDIHTIFWENIKNNKVQYESAIRIKLPSIIVKPDDVYSFYLLGEEPNFITRKCVTANTVRLKEENCEFTGKVVFIQAADPGYDFLFSRKIAGLVTQFGGVNSHMAIRCAELGIPAVIGAGEKNYVEWSRYERITIDCLKKQVVRIK